MDGSKELSGSMCCTRYDRRTGPSHGLTAPSSLVQREWLVSYVEDASVLLRAFCTITQDGCLRIVNWAAHALVLDPWPATTWHIPIAWLVPTGNVGYTPLDNLHFIRMIVLGAVAGFTTLAYVGVSS